MLSNPLADSAPPGLQKGFNFYRYAAGPRCAGGGGGGSALVRVDINTKLIQHSGVCPLPALQENPASVLDDLA